MPDLVPTTTAPSTSGDVRRSVMQRDEEREFLADFIEKSDRLRSRFIPIWDEVMENFLVRPFGDNMLGRYPRAELGKRGRRGSRLADPETHQIVETLSSQTIDLTLGQKKYITAVPRGADDPVKAEEIARLIQGVLELPGVYDTHHRLIKDGFIFGTAIEEVGWETRSRTQFADTGERDENGIPVLSPQEVVYRDQPLIRAVDIYDFYPDPSGTTIQGDMLGVAKRFRITKQQALEMALAGVYDMAAVRRAIAHVNSNDSTAGVDKAGSRQRFGGSIPRDAANKYGMITGFEIWCNYPYPVSDGMSNRVITSLEGEIVRSEGNPYMDGMFPFREVTINPVQGRFYGLGPAEVVRFLQDATNNLLMSFNDAVDLMVSPGWLVGQRWGGDKNRLRRQEFADTIDCRDVTQVIPIPRDFSNIPVMAADYAKRKGIMREASGAANPLQAIEGGDRQTATEVSTLTRFASQRIVTTAAIIEKGFFPDIGKMIHSRLRQFGSRDGFLVTLHGEPLEIPFDAIDVLADIRFGGSRQLSNTFQEVQALQTLIGTLGVNADNLDILAPWIERMADKMEIPDGKEMVRQSVATLQEKQKRLLQEQMLLQQQQSQVKGGRSAPQNAATEAGATQFQGEAVG